MQFTPAKRSEAKARVGVLGPSGSGKTYGALLLARGLIGPAGRIALIDTERKSAVLYESLTPFDVLELDPPFSPTRYQDAVKAAAGYDALIIDSLSHAWSAEGGVLDMVDVAASKSQGNKFAGWKVGTPAQNDLVQAILQAPMHVIATMRAKTEWVIEQNDRGKSAPRRVGVGAVQRDGIEYEFTTVFELDQSHAAMAVKDRTSVFDGRRVSLSVASGEELRAWLAGNPPPTPEPIPASHVAASAKPPQPRTSPDVSEQPAAQRPTELATSEPPAGEDHHVPAPPPLRGPTRKDIGEVIMSLVGGDKVAAKAKCLELLGVDSLKAIRDADLPAAMEKCGAAMAASIPR